MNAVVSAQVRRFAAVGLLAAALVAVVAGLVRPLLQWSYESAEALADARFALRRAQVTAEADKALSAADIAQAERELLPWLLDGGSEAEAAASLQSAVDGVLRNEGLIVESAQAVPTMATGAISRLALDWRGTAPEKGAMRAIAALERLRPLIRIERMALRAIEQGSGLQDQAPITRMNVELRLVGFWAHPQPAPNAAMVRGRQ
jgi:hypothetical protein